MPRWMLSLILWVGFIVVGALIIQFGLYLNDVTVTFWESVWYATLVRFLFMLNTGYRYIEKEYGL